MVPAYFDEAYFDPLLFDTGFPVTSETDEQRVFYPELNENEQPVWPSSYVQII